MLGWEEQEEDVPKLNTVELDSEESISRISPVLSFKMKKLWKTSRSKGCVKKEIVIAEFIWVLGVHATKEKSVMPTILSLFLEISSNIFLLFN